MRKSSYESILRAVGRVLDLAEAERFAVRDTEDGLLVEASDATSTPIHLNLDIPELAQLLDWAATGHTETPRYERASASDEGALQEFLVRHARKSERTRELVGTR
jgi:hypothetical protein